MNYFGKTCPYCKTEIKEGDSIIVCPACNIPHHTTCWVENHGCTTFGCSKQSYKEQGTNPTSFCSNCGTPLGDEQAFCPKCGTAKRVPKKNVCSKCGNELQDEQAFCPKCGQKAGLEVDPGVSSAIDQFNATVNKTNKAKKKKPMKKIIAAVVAVVIIAAGVLVAPKIFVSVEGLCAQGRYIEAYEKASGSEKDEVLAENIIAVLSEEASDELKDPDSFVLREGYYRPFINNDGNLGGYVVLYASGSNSFGAAVSNYMAFTWTPEDQEWTYWGSLSSLDADINTEDWEDMLVKIVVEAAIEDGMKISKDQVENINKQFEENTLYKVELIDYDSIDVSRFSKA